MFKISTFNENKSIKQLSKLTKSIKPNIRLAEKANIRPVPLYPGKFVPLYPIPYTVIVSRPIEHVPLYPGKFVPLYPHTLQL